MHLKCLTKKTDNNALQIREKCDKCLVDPTWAQITNSDVGHSDKLAGDHIGAIDSQVKESSIQTDNEFKENGPNGTNIEETVQNDEKAQENVKYNKH